MDIESLKLYTSSAEGVAEQVTEKVVKSTESVVEEFVKKRVEDLQDFRKQTKVEDRWREADAEYVPQPLEVVKRKRYEADDELGLRARLVRVSDASEDWRSTNSDPTLLAKIQTAISIIIDNNPEAMLRPLTRQNENKTALAYALWKRNWAITNASEKYKLFVFNQARYGWSIGRTFPRRVAFKKEILTEVNIADPSKNVYQDKMLVWFNDVDREVLNPYRTWIDEQTKPYDDYSTNDWYWEKDFSWDTARVEFAEFGFKDLVPQPRDLRVDYTDDKSLSAEIDRQKRRQDLVTIGFYENRLKDLYVIRIPKLGKVLHYCPLPNDDGMLSLWHAPWVLRDTTSPLGISLWETIRQKKELYDKMQNMTMDQLVLSILKMFFYTGTNNLIGDGKIKIQPGKGTQIMNGKVDWMDIPGPGKDAWDGLQFLKNGMDDDSGVTPTLQGAVTGQTLGEVLQAKESALKRLKVPVDNIADAMEQDAYITLSWTAQILSTPEIQDFVTEKEISDYEMEMGVKRQSVTPTGISPQDGQAVGPFQATFLPEIALGLEDSSGKLVESRQDRFFSIGSDIKTGDLKWRGIFKVIPKSVVTSSAELEKQRKNEVFNVMAPLLTQPPELYAKPVQQMLKGNEEDPIDWLPKSWLDFLNQDNQSLFISSTIPGQMSGLGLGGGGMGKGIPSNQTSMQGAAGTTPLGNGPKVVPQQQMSAPEVPGYSASVRNELSRNV